MADTPKKSTMGARRTYLVFRGLPEIVVADDGDVQVAERKAGEMVLDTPGAAATIVTVGTNWEAATVALVNRGIDTMTIDDARKAAFHG